MVRLTLMVLALVPSCTFGALMTLTTGDSAKTLEIFGRQFSTTGQNVEQSVERLDQMGRSYEDRHLGDSALVCYRAALQLSRKQGDTMSVSTEYSKISAVYALQGKLDLALSNLGEALARAAKSTDTAYLKSLAVAKAEIFVRKNKADSAACYFRKALVLCPGAGICKNGLILFELGNAYNNNLLPDSALPWWLQAARAYDAENDPEGKGKAYHDCGVYFAKKKSYHEALQYFDSALAAFTVCKFARGVDETRNTMATVWYNLAVERFNAGDMAGASAALDGAAGYSFSKQFADQISKFRDDIRKNR